MFESSVRYQYQHIWWLIALFVCGTFSPLAIAQARTHEVRRATPVVPPKPDGTEQIVAPAASIDTEDRAKRSTRGGGAINLPSANQNGAAVNSDTSRGRELPNTMRALNDRRPIGIRDKLSLTIVEDELPQRAMIVTDSGEVEVPYIGRILVENRTCKQLAMYIKSILEKEYYHQATVLISLDSAGGAPPSKGRYYIHGEVNRPGAHDIPADEVLTISKAIIRAGGFTQYANEKKVRVHRRNNKTNQIDMFEIDMVAVIQKGQVRNDIEIIAEDKILVSEKFFNF